MSQPTSREALKKAAEAPDPDADLFVRKALIPEIVQAGEGRTVRFVISTGDVDRDNDIINPKGWDLAAYNKNPVVLWAHDYRQLPVGRAVSVSMVDGKLVSECEFADHEFADTVYRLIKGGFLKATSVGFRPKTFLMNAERGGFDFDSQELMEYSIVPVPANPNALIDLRAAKAAGIDPGPLLAWATGVVKAGSLVDEPVPEGMRETTGPDDTNRTFEPVEPEKATSEAEVAVVETPAPEGDKAPSESDDPHPDCDPDEEGACPAGYERGAGGKCHWVEKPKAEDPVTCRVCARALPLEMPRVKDELGLVCAPCLVAARWPESPSEVAAGAPAATADIDADDSALDIDEDVAVELAEDTPEDDILDLSPEEVRAALRSAVTSAVSTIVRDETRAALNRARGRVD